MLLIYRSVSDKLYSEHFFITLLCPVNTQVCKAKKHVFDEEEGPCCGQNLRKNNPVLY